MKPNINSKNKMVDLGGYVIILVETNDKRVKLYGSPADKADLEVADEILEINGKPLHNSSHTEVINHIHNCIKSRTICLRVKRRTGNKLAEELAENSNVQDAFVIAVEQQARERLEKLSALRKIKPVDMTTLSQQLCDSELEKSRVEPERSRNGNKSVYSAPLSQIGSSTNLQNVDSPQSSNQNQSGNVTDEEVELKQNISRSRNPSSDMMIEEPRSRVPVKSVHERGRVYSNEMLNSVNAGDSMGAKSKHAVSINNDPLIGDKVKHASPDRRSRLPSSATKSEANLQKNENDCNLLLSQANSTKPDPSAKSIISGLPATEKKPNSETNLPNEDPNLDDQEGAKGPEEFEIGEEMGKEVLIGGDTDDNRSARGSVRERHLVKTFSEVKDKGQLEKNLPEEGMPCFSSKPLLKPTFSLKSVVDVEEMVRCISRVSSAIEPSTMSSSSSLSVPVIPHNTPDAAISALNAMVEDPVFKLLVSVHNTIQRVQCFQCPPPALCSDARDLVQECMVALQQSHLPESAEILDILNKIEFEGLFYSHDKLAQLQGGMPWKKCLAEMWMKDKPEQTSNTKVVKITKHNEPLGATVRNEGEKVVIGRVVKGGAAERSGNLQPGDEVLEVNGLKLCGKSVHDICSTLCQMSGTLTFVIIPAQPANQKDETSQPVYHFRAHFSYTPDDDLYIPCHELGISFQRGDILHVISKDDPHWWQAYRDGEWTQTLAGLIPSLALQQHRLALQKQKRDQEAREQQQQSPRRKASAASLLCARKTNKRKRHNSPFKRDKSEAPPYEEMALYYPQPNQKRPLILVGPPSIGRHELRQRLLDDTSKFAAPIPHTSRTRENGEIDGSDYHFISRTQFETEAANGKFLEHGEYDKQFYGTSLDSIRTVVNSGKICVLNLQPTSLPAFHESDLKPYVVFLTPASPQVSRHQAHKNGQIFKEEDYRELVSISHNMEEQYGQFFDSVIPFEEVEFVLKQLMYEISLLEREPQWVPAKWVEETQTQYNSY